MLNKNRQKVLKILSNLRSHQTSSFARVIKHRYEQEAKLDIMPVQRVERDDNSRLVTRLLNTSSRSVGKKVTTDNQRQDAIMRFKTIGEINSKVKRPLTRSNRREMRSTHHTTVSKIGGSVKRSPDHIVGR